MSSLCLSRDDWLKVRERFYAATRQREKQNSLPNMRVGGRIAETHQENKELISEAYRQTFLKRRPHVPSLNKVKQALEMRGKHLGQEHINRINNFMDLENKPNIEAVGGMSLNDDWLYPVLDSLPMFKAPGPDGIPNEFYYLMRNNLKLLRILKEAIIAVVHHGVIPSPYYSPTPGTWE